MKNMSEWKTRRLCLAQNNSNKETVAANVGPNATVDQIANAEMTVNVWINNKSKVYASVGLTASVDRTVSARNLGNVTRIRQTIK